MMLLNISNPIQTLWPEALMILLAVAYLVGLKSLGSISSTRVRLLMVLGFLVTGGTASLGINPSLYTIVAIVLIPAVLVFAVLVFRPGLFKDWNRARIYLTSCIVLCAVTWTTQAVWLFTR